MTKEELEKEAEKFAKTEMSHPNEYGMYYCTFLKVAEPREKRIAELEAQIEKMKCCYNCKNCAYAGFEIICRTYNCINQSRWEIKEK